MHLPDLPPRIRFGFETTRQVLSLGVSLFEHPFRIVSQLRHTQRVIGLDDDEQRFFKGRHALVVGHNDLSPVDGRHIGASAKVISRHMHLVLGQ